MIRVIVPGATGKMGGAITRLVCLERDMELAGVTERKNHPCLGSDIGPLLGLGKKGIGLSDDLSAIIDRADVLIDFTTPEATITHLKLALQAKKGMVIGTTGFESYHLQQLKEASTTIPIVSAPNMAVGVNLLLKLVKEAAAVLGEYYDCEIVEAHHHHKHDAPSGTALRLAKVAAETLGRDLEKVGTYSRKGMIGPRSREEIGISVIRGGDVVGDHTVFFLGEGERLELTHRASSREIFARGALRAARFVSQAAPGLYDMGDVLGLNES
ncbi:MAG: 4-hydroxy-tetrahydrodipicolinate reductase [bacterium]|nr:4-hydroxy-tetrahydrodipicolinate reductase [bacterium]